MEKILYDLKNTVDGAVKKSGEIIELTKTKMAMTETKNAIREKVIRLGELTYFATKGEDMPEYDAEELIAEIDELKQTLSEQEAKAADLAGKKICPRCKKVMDADFAFCPACGIHMEDDETEED
ncbi:MAG: zinc-ribbon domain-containing protein [Ruminococcaceae bacterium]|nr:zinc-ribbon domain-containing protein [Oscillospiraceae bacterium]